MKPILTLCAVILFAAIAAIAWKYTGGEDHHGQAFTGLPSAAITDLATRPADFIGKPVSVRGRLMKQCKMSGCWFYLVDPADSGGRELFVEMGDTTPTLPKRVGQTAHVEGQLIKYGDAYQFIGIAVTFEKDPK